MNSHLQQPHEPHKIKTVRLLPFPTPDERKKHLADAQFNVFNLKPSQVTFDMCSNAMNAVSQEQLSAQFLGDEAYAGSRNFENLQRAVNQVFGHSYVCPVHNVLGGIKLLLTTLGQQGSVMPTNHWTWVDVLTTGGLDASRVNDQKEQRFTGNVELSKLESLLAKGDVRFVDVQAFADGQHPLSLKNLRALYEMTRNYGVRLVCNGSRAIENAWYIQQHEPGWATHSIATIVKQLAKNCDIFLVDGSQDPKCNTGGLITTDHPGDYERFMNAVVVYEGLHTYGGMAGRTMEMLARGLVEMCDEAEVHWVMGQTERFTRRLEDGSVPLTRGCDGAYIDTDRFFPDLEDSTQDTFSAALYQISGVRALAHGRVGRGTMVPVQIPRLAMTNEQLDQVADAIISLYRQNQRVPQLQVSTSGRWRDQMKYHGIFADLQAYEFDTFPYEIHTLEHIGSLSREEREKAIRAAGYNTFLLSSADVSIDLLTDSGTSAMSTDQWAAYDATRATMSNSDAYEKLVENLRELTGYAHVIPTHQGRAAEHILSNILIKPGQLVPGNMYFTTTKLHQELAGGVFADVIVDEAHSPQSQFLWKGNIDIAKLDALVDKYGVGAIAYVSFEHCVNMAGGQPASMDNMKEVYVWCQERSIPLIFDATRCVENARLIQSRDPRYRDVKIRDILQEMMLYGDGCTVSGKKDFLINIGGLQAFRDNAEWAHQARELLRLYEGNVTDGGLATADIATMARGVEEMLDDRYIRSRVAQTRALGEMLLEGSVPIVEPPGGHAIFLDAKRFLPHIDQDAYPAQALAAAIYVETGVRTMERGNVSKGRNPETGENYRPALELVRLTIPRRVYTNDHMRAVADGIIRLYQRRDTIRGLRFVYEPTQLRFFQARFEPLEFV